MTPSPAAEHPFKRVANEIRAMILRGELAPGDKIPSENQLADQFEVTRSTVRKGIALLRMEGLVTSHQGKGAFVRERPHVSLRLTGSIYRARRATGESNYNAEARAQGQRALQTVREVAETAAPEKVADRFGIEAGAPVIVRRLLFLVNDAPMQLVDSYDEPSLATGTPLALPKKIKGGAHAVIENPDGPIRRRIVRFIEDLDIRMPYPHEAELLDIPAGVPVAKVMRTAYDSAGEVLEVQDSVVPCDRHTFRYVIDV
jgi:GntR family transcriptional regulator